ncbi:hypothetical protein OG429_28985 [Streptomyces sp. NBC_00190]|nr:hypothetical protein [Streptomyces sp. NBC_00190]
MAVLGAAVLVGGGFAAAVLMEDDPKSPAASAPPASPSVPASSSPTDRLTPATGKKMTLDKPTGQKDGISTGWQHSPIGSVSAAVYWWEGYAFLDDQKAAQQLSAMVSPNATGLVDKQVSDVRKLREAVGLPPSGGTTSEVRFTTSVTAVRALSVPAPGIPKGDVVEVWMNYDRYATGPDGAPDKDPRRNELTSVILRWQNGTWKLTNEFDKLSSPPVAYFPDSPYAWQDRWVQVLHG